MQNYPTGDPSAQPTSPPTPKRRRHRWIRWLGLFVFLIAALIVIAPTLVSTSWARGHIESAAADALGTKVRIGDLGFSWFSGISIEDLEVANPPGYPESHPALALRSARGDVSLIQLFRGRLDVSGKADGLRLYVDQRDDGRTNFEALSHGQVQVESRDVQLDESDAKSDWLGRVRLDLDLSDGLLEISREGRVLESLRNASGSIKKEFDTSVLLADFNAALHKPSQPEDPGRLQLHADIDAKDKRVDAQLAAAGLDLSRYGPLIAVFMEPGQITELQGVLNGTMKARVLGSERVFLEGSLTVDGPRLAGALVRGMDLHAERWTLHPNLEVHLKKAGLPEVSAARLSADLGFLQVQGLDEAEARELLEGGAGLGLRYTLDLDRIAEFGGPLPAALRGSGSTVTGSLAVPIIDGELPAMEELVAKARADADLRLSELLVEGFRLTGLQGSASMRGGIVQVRTGAGTALNTGPFELNASLDLNDRQTMPFDLALGWSDGMLDSATVPLVRYAVPLLAGLGRNAAFRSSVDLRFELRGPTLPREGESVLHWLDDWSGAGELALDGGTVTPAPELQALLELTGQDKALDLEGLHGSFRMEKGFVQTQLLEWQSKGQKYGLTGKTGLDGRLDWMFDLTSILQRHKDGQKVLAALEGAKLTANLQGTLDAPRLAPPDLSKLLQSGVEGAVQDALNDLIKGKDPQSELQKQLDKLFGRKKGL